LKIGRVFPDLLTPLGHAATVDEGLERTLRRLVDLTGARAAALAFRPPRAAPVVVSAARGRRGPERDAALGALVAAPGGPGGRPRERGPGGVMLRVALGPPRRPVGELVLLGRRGELSRAALPAGFPRELGRAIEQVWRLHQRTLRITALNAITGHLVSSASVDDVLRAFVDGLARLVGFDSIAVLLADAERGDIEVVDAVGRSVPRVPRRDTRMPREDTLAADVVARGAPVRVDDLAADGVPARTRAVLGDRGYRSALLVPLASAGGVLGAVALVAVRRAAFDAADVEVVSELARPLAFAIEQRRLLDESRRRAEELAALYGTSQLITAQLDVASVLDRIARSVTTLTGATGCGIGLLDADGAGLRHVAAYGFRSEAWRALALPLGEGIMGGCAASGQPVRVDDVRADPRSARRDVDDREGVRSMLCVPLRGAGSLAGVISAFSRRPAAFTAHHQRVLEAFAEQAGIAIQNAQLFEQSERRARETRALLEAGRAVTASLEAGRTVRVIMEQARAVLGVESCGIMALDPATGELSSVASLDLPPAMISRVRIREGEGIAGAALRDGRPVQSPDLFDDPRVLYPELPRASGFRSMLAAPLRIGDVRIGVISVFRRDVHRFSMAEEDLLQALADQAAIALEHARLYERLEARVEERTVELERQKRFVEVVLETLPVGVFVLDANLRVVRANREGARALACAPTARGALPEMLPADRASEVEGWLRDAGAARQPGRREVEVTVAGEAKVFRFSVAPLEGGEAGVAHVVLVVEDVTLAKQLERQMLLTERLTTAGRLAAGVAHELNNPLATIAGCAESLSARLKEGDVAARPELADFPAYLRLIEEEAFRCKEITGSLLGFVREPGSRRTPTDVNALVAKTVELLSHQSRFGAAEILTELDPGLPPLTLNEGQLRQVFLGIASNALEAMDGHGRLTVRSHQARGAVEVEFEDQGPGIPPEVAARVFDPFFTTKPPGQGTGLGLAIAQGIVADHGGRIELVSAVGRGSTFRVVLPS
jgi:two-component system NtrC family sensor kinase